VSEETDNGDHFDLLLQKKIPVVFFDRIVKDLNTSKVVTDNYEIALEGTEHLIEQRCKRIAWISGPQHLNNSKDRLQGYMDALTKHGIPVQEEYIIKSHFNGGNVEQYTNYLLNLPHLPDGIFAINDYAAIEMIHHIKRRGLQIPKDIAILGFNNERIDVFKFRSLHHDQADPLASKVVTKNDPRVTRVGRFIRKTSLDELPQLFNVVFKSNLSLVGPRPHAVQGKLQSRLFDEAVDGYFARHRVKPGITGWAQINGWRGEVDSEEKIQKRVEFDLYYIENWSVLFDLYILLKTPLALMTKNENAY